MPSSATDRFTVDYEKLYFFTKSEQYYFEQQFEPYDKTLDRWGGNVLKADGKSLWDEGTGQNSYRNRNMRPNEEGRNRRAVWDINTEACPEAHFAVYPESLVLPCIQAGCPENGVVYDPFMGSGTTAKMCIKTNRNYIGSELSKKYCEIAEKRLKPYKNSIDMFYEQTKNQE